MVVDNLYLVGVSSFLLGVLVTRFVPKLGDILQSILILISKDPEVKKQLLDIEQRLLSKIEQTALDALESRIATLESQVPVLKISTPSTTTIVVDKENISAR